MSRYYTCIGKGGKYELLGHSLGAGACRNESRVVYRDVETGQLYHRTADEFVARMELIDPKDCPVCDGRGDIDGNFCRECR